MPSSFRMLSHQPFVLPRNVFLCICSHPPDLPVPKNIFYSPQMRRLVPAYFASTASPLILYVLPGASVPRAFHHIHHAMHRRELLLARAPNTFPFALPSGANAELRKGEQGRFCVGNVSACFARDVVSCLPHPGTVDDQHSFQSAMP